MAAPRPPLAEAVRDPGFTPRLRDVGELVDLLADDALEKHAARAIARAGLPALATLVDRFASAEPPLRARVLGAIGRFADRVEARAALLAALGDADPKTRRNAAMALGHVAAPEVEQALLAAWESDPRPEMRRTLAASLGKIGGAASVELLAGAARAGDPELARIASRASMMVDRTASRAARGRIDAARRSGRPAEVELVARRGIEPLVAEELVAVRDVSEVRVTSPGLVRARLAGPLHALFASRTALSFRFPLPTEWVRDGEAEPDAVVRAVTSDVARDVLTTWTDGAVRYRIAWDERGHRRATTWATAQAIARRAPDFVNDPTESLWEVVVRTNRRFVDVALAPRSLPDPRFAWRRADVPAASHPTIAAALARVAGVRDDDVVWDPFVGSGGELVERALLGRSRQLLGSDVEPSALRAARENLDAAGVAAELSTGDALTLSPPGVTLVITNPPMGRRASRTADLADTLDAFVRHVASVLPEGGRFVWMAPWPRRARDAAEGAGLSLVRALTVDMGGFDAELQRWDRS